MYMTPRNTVVLLLGAGGVLPLVARSSGSSDDNGNPISNGNTDALMDNISELFNRTQENIWL